MRTKRGFTIMELILVVAILGIIAVFALPHFFDMSGNATQASEDGTVGAVRSGINNYYGESQIEDRDPLFPATLDNANDGTASIANPLFGTVLENGITQEWEKSGLTYTGPAGNVYNYYPQKGTFTTSPVPSGFTGYWPMNEGSGTSAGSGDLEGTFSGNVEWTDGVDGGGLDFDGVDSFMSVPDADIFDLTDEGTLAAWIDMDSLPAYAGFIHKGDATNFSDEAYTLQLWTGNRLALGITNDAGQLTLLQSNTVIQPNQLYHIAATWDSNGMNIYINGQLDSFNTQAVSARNSDGNLNIGAQLPTYYNGGWRNLPVDGMMDEVMVYDRAMSADQLSEYYDYYQ